MLLRSPKHITDSVYVFKVSAFGFNACTKTCAPLSDCCINNALIRVTSSYY